MDKIKIVKKVSFYTILFNTILAFIKLFAGIFSNSSAMISDSVHSFSDVGTTIIAFIGIIIANKDDDDSHRYGHERLECVASIILSMILFMVGVEIGISGIKSLIKNDYGALPGVFSIVAAILSIVVKELMYHYTIRAARKVNSNALKADAWHHRSDSLSSVGALFGIILSRCGFPYFDIVASIVIAVIICKIGIEIFIDATDKLVDKSCNNEMVDEIKKVVLQQKGVLEIDDIKTRIFAEKIYVDIEISADGNKTLNETHAIAHKVHDAVEKTFSNVKHCMVHVNPYKEDIKSEKK